MGKYVKVLGRGGAVSNVSIVDVERMGVAAVLCGSLRLWRVGKVVVWNRS